MLLVTALTERGSILPFFLGLIALGLVLALGSAEICAEFVAREQVQQSADQLALKAAAATLDEPSVAAMTTKGMRLTSLSRPDSSTTELELCLPWKSWLGASRLCARAKAR